MPDLRAYVDESKVDKYLMAAVVCEARNIPGLRRIMMDLRFKGQRRTHMRKESKSRQRQIFNRVMKSQKVVFVFAESSSSSAVGARFECLAQLVAEFTRLGVTEIVFELDQGFVASDRRALAAILGHSPKLTYRHEEPHLEPLLWMADTVAWGKSKGWI